MTYFPDASNDIPLSLFTRKLFGNCLARAPNERFGTGKVTVRDYQLYRKLPEQFRCPHSPMLLYTAARGRSILN